MKKVKFKPIEEVDFTKCYPLVNDEIYKIIAGKELRLTESQFKDLMEKKVVTFAGQSIPGDFIQVEKSENETTSHDLFIQNRQRIKSEFATKYLFMDDLVDVIVHGIELRMNVMLYGKGGHNKSEGTMEVLKELNVPSESIYVKAFGEGLTIEDLYGGVKMKGILENDIIEYNVLNSFMNYEYVVFEEFFDAPAPVLLALKDILTSGYFRNGNQIFKIKCKSIIALTNRTKDEVVTDDSIEALTQRFQLWLKVEWPQNTYTIDNFNKLTKLVLGEAFYKRFKKKVNTLSQIAAESNNGHVSFISPRTYLSAVKTYCNGASLNFINDIDHSLVEDILTKANTVTVDIGESEALFTSISGIIHQYDLMNVVDSAAALVTNVDRSILRKAKLLAIIELIEGSTFHSSVQTRVIPILTTLKNNYQQM